jgi:transcriptional regulator with XRE-family HTH domain
MERHHTKYRKARNRGHAEETPVPSSPQRGDTKWWLPDPEDPSQAPRQLSQSEQSTLPPPTSTEALSTSNLRDAFQDQPLSEEFLPGPKKLQRQNRDHGQKLQNERELRGWTQKHLANMLGLPVGTIKRWEKNLAYPDIQSRQKLANLLEEDVPNLQVENGLSAFFQGFAKIFISGTLCTAFWPFFEPVVATDAITLFAVKSIQDKLELVGLHLQEETISKLLEPPQGKPLDEGDLRLTIEEALSQDSQVNEDLALAFIDLMPTIENAASTNPEISGLIRGLIADDENMITQAFSNFLKANE